MSDSENEDQETARRKQLEKSIFGSSDEDSEDNLPLKGGNEKRKKIVKKKKKKKSGDDGQGSSKRRRISKGSKPGRGESGDQEGSDDGDGFIDDSGAPTLESDGESSDGERLPPEEAEEARPGEEEGAIKDEIDELFDGIKMGTRNRRKNIFSEDEQRSMVTAFLAKMELAAENDVELNHRKQPAVNKLKMLPEVMKVLEKTHLHNELLNSGVLDILKEWLSPLPDGSLPNLKVRSTLLRLIGILPIAVEKIDVREQLKKSQLGKVVMFMYKCPDENIVNKRMAQALVEKWSRPIFELNTRYDEMKEYRKEEAAPEEEREHEKEERGAALGDDDLGNKEGDSGPRVGDAGYRYHAAVPQPVRMDFTKRPESKIHVEEVKSKLSKSETGKALKLTRQVQRLRMASRKKDVHAAKVSLEGRGMVTYDT